MIQDLIDLLVDNINPKLNHLIIYLLTNTCCCNMVRARLLEGKAVRAIIGCGVFENKETDISTFLFNFLCNLPFNYSLPSESKDCII
jgi:hypothetical protein